MHFHLKDIEALVRIGITAEERATPQLLKFAVEFEYDASQAAQSDDIADTVDYQVIYDTIKTFTQSREWNLLETLHTDLHKELTNNSKYLKEVQLSIQKFPWPDGSVTVN